MSGIRLANIPDIDEICKLGRELQAQSVFADIPADESKYRLFIAGLMGMKREPYGWRLMMMTGPKGFCSG